MSDLIARLSDNLAAVRQRIETACSRAGRSPDVRLAAVTKYARLEWVRALRGLGLNRFGESRPQQLLERAAALADDSPAGDPIEWHLVGHLQRNKVRPLLPAVSLIHSVDSLRLLERISQVAAERRQTPRVLLEVNVSGEPSKQGFSPDSLRSEWDRLVALDHVSINGLMTMAPPAEDGEASRPIFRSLRELRDELQARSPERVSLVELSMGMSGDFEAAIAEGATLVRIGSLLFEGLAVP